MWDVRVELLALDEEQWNYPDHFLPYWRSNLVLERHRFAMLRIAYHGLRRVQGTSGQPLAE